MISKWSKNSVFTNFSSSYYDNGILDYYDHLLEARPLKQFSATRKKSLICLDLASGNGRFTEVMLDYASHIDVVDFEVKHIEFMKKRFNSLKISYHLSDVTDFIDDCTTRYDIIVLSGLLLFFDDETAKTLIVKLSKSLRPGGVIFIRDFLAKAENFSAPSNVFDNTILYYRNQHFYEELGGRNFIISRPRHSFVAIEQHVFGLLKFPIYRVFWNKASRIISWLRSPYRNTIFFIEAS